MASFKVYFKMPDGSTEMDLMEDCKDQFEAVDMAKEARRVWGEDGVYRSVEEVTK